MVVATTAVALLLNGSAMLIYEIRSYRANWLRDLKLQADIIGQSSKSALAFNDPQVAAENLQMLKLRPDIEVAVIYRADGQRFASYHREAVGANDVLLGVSKPGLQFTWREVILTQTVMEDGRVVGQILLRSRHDLTSRVVDYRLPLALQRNACLIEERQPDLIEIGDPFSLGWSAVKAGQRLGVPVVGFCHGNVEATAARWGGATLARWVLVYLRNIYRECDLVLAPSSDMVAKLRAWGNVLPASSCTKLEALHELQRHLRCDHVLFAGDDVTDELAFAKAPPSWLTVKVGPVTATTHAAYSVPTP